MKIIDRRGWGARSARNGVRIVGMRDRTAFMIHHSGGPAEQPIRSIQDWCMDGRGFLDIDYNFLVAQNGTVFEGRGWAHAGSHCVDWNTRAIGVCVVGTNELSAAAVTALRALYAAANRKAGHRLTPLVHRDQAQTDCPGPKITGWVHAGGLSPRDLYLVRPNMSGADVRVVQKIVGAEADGIFGPATSAAVKTWQKGHALKADGIVGPHTRAAMGL